MSQQIVLLVIFICECCSLQGQTSKTVLVDPPEYQLKDSVIVIIYELTEDNDIEFWQVDPAITVDGKLLKKPPTLKGDWGKVNSSGAKKIFWFFKEDVSEISKGITVDLSVSSHLASKSDQDWKKVRSHKSPRIRRGIGVFNWMKTPEGARLNYFVSKASIGLNRVDGDVGANAPFHKNLGVGGNIEIFYHRPKLEYVLEGSYGRVYAYDQNSNKNYQDRNLHFRSKNLGATLGLRFLWFTNSRSYTYRGKWSPYFQGGLGVIYFSNQAQLRGDWIDLQPLGTEGQNITNGGSIPYSPFVPQFYFGGGIRMTVSDRWDFWLDYRHRWLMTDYLDDVSGDYTDYEKLYTQNPTAALLSNRREFTRVDEHLDFVGMPRGDGQARDAIANLSVGISFIFGFK